jgi:hypothetical protein
MAVMGKEAALLAAGATIPVDPAVEAALHAKARAAKKRDRSWRVRFALSDKPTWAMFAHVIAFVIAVVNISASAIKAASLYGGASHVPAEAALAPHFAARHQHGALAGLGGA